MFTGIIECLGTVEKITRENENIDFTISSPISRELKVDQSISHNGVCLTVIEKNDHNHVVTAIKQTLDLSNLSKLQTGMTVNLERCTQMNGRLDGHLVQGHVDGLAECTGVHEEGGSWRVSFRINEAQNNLMVPKGSITVNGTSLTLADVRTNEFDVAIIPYTYNHTNFQNLTIGSVVNLEFDVLVKYLAKMLPKYK